MSAPRSSDVAAERVKARVDATATQHLDPHRRAELIRQSKERT